MPNIRSAKKALRQSIRRRVQNTHKKDVYKKIAKQIRAFAMSGKADKALTLIPQVYKSLDKASKTGAIKKNTASRLKSRLSKLAARKSS